MCEPIAGEEYVINYLGSIYTCNLVKILGNTLIVTILDGYRYPTAKEFALDRKFIRYICLAHPDDGFGELG